MKSHCPQHHRNLQCQICLWLTTLQGRRDHEAQLQRILDAFLHGLCDAALMINGCKCHSTVRQHVYWYGRQGHSKAGTILVRPDVMSQGT